MSIDYHDFQRQQFKRKLADEFKDLCPSEYRSTRLDHPSMPVTSKRGVLEWSPAEERGVLFQGETGHCKTRCAWLILERLMTKEGIRCQAITDPSFSREYSKRIGNGSADAWMDTLVKVPVLFIDDFGKAAVTPRYKEQFYDILESRTSRGKPLILTTQLNRDELIARFGDEDGKAIVRRVIEFCELVHL